MAPTNPGAVETTNNAVSTTDYRIAPVVKQTRLKLDGSNYVAWRRTVKLTLNQKDLLYLIKAQKKEEREEKSE
jgi:hypothetical protein